MRRLTNPVLIVAIYLSMITSVLGQAMVVYRTVPAQMPSTGLVASYNFTEGYDQVVFNRAGTFAYPSTTNLFGNNGEQFKASITNNEGWAAAAGTTLTDFFATDPNGNNGATRLVTSGGAGQGIFTTLTLAAVTYTISFYVKSNTGSTQHFRLWDASTTISSDLPITTSWGQQSYTFTGAAGSNAIALTNDAANDAMDILIYGARLETGGSAKPYLQTTFNLQLGSQPGMDSFDPGWQTYGIDLGASKYTYGISTVGASTTNFSVYVVAKKTGSPGAGGLDPIIDNGNAGVSGFFSINAQDAFSDPLNGNQRPDFIFGTAFAYANSINLSDGAWHIFAGTYDGTTLKFYIDGTEVARKTSSQSALSIQRLYLGEYPILSKSLFYFPGSVGMSAVYSVVHSASSIQSTVTAIQSNMACRGIAVGPQSKFITIDGDSISSPDNTATGLTILQGWSYLLFHDISPVIQGRNFAVSGATLTNMDADMSAILATHNPNTAKNIVVLWYGRNDLVSASPATFVAHLKTNCQTLRAAGFKVVIIPILPSTLAGFNANRNTANGLIAADPSFWDVFATPDPAMWSDANAADTGKYSDGTHPTASAMSTYVEPVIKTAVTSLF